MSTPSDVIIASQLCFAIINHNREDSLARTIRSIKNIAGSAAKIILIDDGSTDESLTVSRDHVNDIIRKDSREGIAASRRSAFEATNSKLIFFIDSDIEILQCDISSIISFFEQDPLLAGMSGSYESAYQGEGNRVLDLRRKWFYFKYKRSFSYTLGHNYVTYSGGFSVIHKERCRHLPVYKFWTGGGEDLIFQLRVLSEGFHFRYETSIKGLHHHHRSATRMITKGMSDARGSILVGLYAKHLNLYLPFMEEMYAFPGFLLIALFSKYWILFLSLEFSPYLWVIIRERNIYSVGLLLYALICCPSRIVYLLRCLCSTHFDLSTKIRYLLFAVSSPLPAKLQWWGRAINEYGLLFEK